MSDDLKIEQCDRERAAQVYDARPTDWSAASDQVRRGLHDDTAIVQAFAAHRIEASRPSTDEVEQVAIAIASPILRQFDGWRLDKPVDWEEVGMTDRAILREIATAAITALRTK